MTPKFGYSGPWL